MIERRLELYLEKVGADLVAVLGSNQQQVQEWKNKLHDRGFIVREVTPHEENVYVHAVVLVDAECNPDWNADCWQTLICLDPNFTLQLAHEHGFAACFHDTHKWNGVDFVHMSYRMPYTSTDPLAMDNMWGDAVIDPGMMDNIWEVSISPAWPDLVPYRKDIYLLYAGAGVGTVSTRRHQDVLQEVKQAFIDGYTRILFYNGDETMHASSIMACQRIADYYDKMMNHTLPKNTFIYLCGAPDARQTYETLTHHYNFSFPMMCRGYFRFELLHRAAYNNIMHSDEQLRLKEYLQTPYQVGKRDKKFLNFNRVPRPHRMMLASKLKAAGLLDNGYMSFSLDRSVEHSQMVFQHYYPYDDDNPHYMLDHQHFCEFSEQDCPMVLNRSADRDNPVNLDSDDVDYYANSYFSIVSETIFHSNYDATEQFYATFISEKSWKPLFMRHPFVIVGRPKTLQMLRDIGYQTFHPYIDESYDNIVDDYTRMTFIWRELERLINLSDSEWIEIQKNIARIVDHNYNHFCNFDKRLYLDAHSIANYF